MLPSFHGWSNLEPGTQPYSAPWRMYPIYSILSKWHWIGVWFLRAHIWNLQFCSPLNTEHSSRFPRTQSVVDPINNFIECCRQKLTATAFDTMLTALIYSRCQVIVWNTIAFKLVERILHCAIGPLGSWSTNQIALTLPKVCFWKP